MKRNALLMLACCLLMGVTAMVVAPVTAMAIPYHAADSELTGSAYAVFNPTTGELDFVRSTETHANESTGTVTSISGGTYTGTIYKHFETSHVVTFTSWYEISSSVRSVRFVDAVRPPSTEDWVLGMGSCTSLDLSRLDTSQVTNMRNMFSECSALTSLDLSSFDTSKVENMDSMFGECTNLTSLDLSTFDTGNVTSMTWMFYHCPSLTSLDVSSFDTSKATDMRGMLDSGSNLNKITVGDKFVIS